MRFGQDILVVGLCRRSIALWSLGYPKAALVDVNNALTEAREIGQAATLFMALFIGSWLNVRCGSSETASALANELAVLADEKDAAFWKMCAIVVRGLSAALGNAPNAVQLLTSGLGSARPIGATQGSPIILAHLAEACAQVSRHDDALRFIDEAMMAIEKTKERWCEAEVNRIAGLIALKSLEQDAAKAQAYFERALAIARKQQAKSWELRAAMSLARLWRDQGKLQQARELLAPVYGWFTEGFDTRDLKEAKGLLEKLAS
jgi:predicted ATPase